MLLFTVILAAMLFIASAGLMSVAEPACERPRTRRQPVLDVHPRCGAPIARRQRMEIAIG